MSAVVVGEAADAGVKGLVQIRLEGGAPQAPKAVTEGLSSQQIDNVLTSCDAQEVKPTTPFAAHTTLCHVVCMSPAASSQPHLTGCPFCLPIVPLLWYQWVHLSVRTGQAPC